MVLHLIKPEIGQTVRPKLIEFLLQTGVLASAAAHEIQVGAAYVGMAVHYNFFKTGRASQEGALDANAIAGHTAHSEVFVIAASAGANHCATEFLDALVVAFFDAQENLYCVARADVGDVGIFGSFYRVEYFLSIHVINPYKRFVNCAVG